VLLRVEAAGVCHSDVHIWDGYFDLGDGRRISLESRGVHLHFTKGHEPLVRATGARHLPDYSRFARPTTPLRQLGASKDRLFFGTNRAIPAWGCGGSARAGQPGFFDGEDRLKALSAAGDPLEGLAVAIDFEVFRRELERAVVRSDRGKGGRPPYDATVIAARRPRLTRAEKQTIKGGGVPAEWKPARRAQIDRDGRWTIKRGAGARRRRVRATGASRRSRCPCSATKIMSTSIASTGCCGAIW
jgi:Alcohol dehydrogenase GroES-like domain